MPKYLHAEGETFWGQWGLFSWLMHSLTFSYNKLHINANVNTLHSASKSKICAHVFLFFSKFKVHIYIVFIITNTLRINIYISNTKKILPFWSPLKSKWFMNRDSNSTPFYAWIFTLMHKNSAWVYD